MIYAVHILDSKFVKIGYSSAEDSSARIAALQTGSPFEITELFCINGTLKQEQTLHALLKLAFGRVRVPIPPNEWYPGKSHFFREFLEYLKYGFEPGMAYLAKYQASVKQPGKKGDDVSPNIKWPTIK